MTTKTPKPGAKSHVLAFEGTEKNARKVTAHYPLHQSRKGLKQGLNLRAAFPANDAAFATTRASHHVTDRMQGYGTTPLRANELQSVYALFAWVANEQGAAIDTVQAMTETRFSVNDVTKLQQKDYDEVIRFLVDLRIDELTH
jgi:hypothetical protein